MIAHSTPPRSSALPTLGLCLAAAACLWLPAAASTARSLVEQDERLAELAGLEVRTEYEGAHCVPSASGLALCEPRRQEVLVPGPDARAAALDTLAEQGILLIPDSTDKRLMAFHPETGDLIDANFLLLDDEATGTAIHALRAPNGNILVSDQTRHVVHSYTLAGAYQGVFAPAGGANTAILQNIRGMAFRPNGHLLVTVGAGDNADAVAEFDAAGNFVGNFVANGSGGLDSPYDVFARTGVDWLVTSTVSDEILRFGSSNGAALGSFADLSSFPQQMVRQADGNVLVGNFSGAQSGVVELTEAGELVGVHTAPDLTGYRGVYPLPNGNILTTTSGGVYEIDRSGNLVATKQTGQSRFIQFVPSAGVRLQVTVGPEPEPFDEGFCPHAQEAEVTLGTEIRWCYVVTNHTPMTFTRHDLESEVLGTILDGFNFTLAPGSSVYLWQTSTFTEEVHESATWTAYNPGPLDVHSGTGTAVAKRPLIFADGFESGTAEAWSSTVP